MSGLRLLLLCNIFGLSFLVNHQQALAAPQDLQTSMLLAVGQVKDTIDKGAAMRDSKGFEFAGMKFKNDMEFGVGDAIKKKEGGDNDNDDDDDRRRKRAADARSSSEFLEDVHSKFTQDELRKKRSAEDSDSSSSSSSSSGESSE